MRTPRVAFVYSGGREVRWACPDASDGPSEFFYGATELHREGWTVKVVDFIDQPHSVAAALSNAIIGRILPVRVRAEHLIGAWSLRHILRDTDVIIASTSYIALAIETLRALGMRLPPVVAVHCGIANHSPSYIRQRVSSCLLGRQQSIFFAAAEAVETARIFSLSDSCVHANAFGVDSSYWTPPDQNRGRRYILSVGNDARRDYATLVQAAGGWDVPVKILTKRDIPGPIPPNVELLNGSWHSPAVTDSELRELYRGAAAVVIPLIDSAQPSGQSVALQAMACGCPVVMSRTSGLWTGDDFIDGEHIRLVCFGSAAALGGAVQELLDRPDLAAAMGSNAASQVKLRGDVAGFAVRLKPVILKAAAWQIDNSAVV